MVTKSEIPGASELRDELAKETGREVLLISSVIGDGLKELTHVIAKTLKEQAANKKSGQAL